MYCFYHTPLGFLLMLFFVCFAMACAVLTWWSHQQKDHAWVTVCFTGLAIISAQCAVFAPMWLLAP